VVRDLLVIMAGVAFGLTCGIVAGPAPHTDATAWPSYMLTRGWLTLHRRLPWPLMSFLADAHDRGVLRQAGAVYQFRHIELQRSLGKRSPGKLPSCVPNRHPRFWSNAVQKRPLRGPPARSALWTWPPSGEYLPVMRVVLALAGSPAARPALRGVAGLGEPAQLDLEEEPVQRPRQAPADAEELVRRPLPQFRVISHPGTQLVGVLRQHQARRRQRPSG
jgi:hypothetical protein